MCLKIKPEIQIQFSSQLEALVILDIATELLGYKLASIFDNHFTEGVLREHYNSKYVRVRLLDGDIRLVHSTCSQGIRLNFQEFIEYAAKQ